MSGLRQGWMAGLVALAVGCAVAEGDSEDRPPAKAEGAQTVTRVVNVETEVVTSRGFVDYIRITGEAEANHEILVSAEEGGMLGEFSVAKGQRVRRGQILTRTDASVLEAQVAEATAAAALAQDQFERQRRLWEEEGIGSEISFIQAKYQAEMAQARLAVLEARLAKTVIRAPVAGVFEDRFVEPGEIVAPGSQVARVVAIDSIKISGGVPERYAAHIRRGEPARITFDILPDRMFEGTIGFVGSTVDERSRTFPVEIVIENPEGLVKPRMVANVRLVREQLRDVLVVQQDHVVRSEVGYFVFVLDERDGQLVASRRPVRLGASAGNEVVIETGLAPGDRLITLGAQLVQDGSHVRVVDPEAEVAEVVSR